MNEEELYRAWKAEVDVERKHSLELELYRVLAKHAAKICWIVLRDTPDEVVNEACYRAMTQDFQGKAKFSTWFFSIVRNLCLNSVKQNARRREKGLSNLTTKDFKSSSFMASSTSEMSFHLRDMLSKLSPADQQLLELRLAEMSYDTMAEELDTTPGALRVRWSRLKRKIATLI